MRKIIQFTAAPYDNSVAINALCDDGTLWEMNGGRWEELPVIPQDESKDPLAVAVGKLNDIESVALSMKYHAPFADTIEQRGEQILEILKGK